MSSQLLSNYQVKLGNYADTQKAAVTVLGMLGLKLNPKTRLDIFRLTLMLDREYRDRPETREARNLLERLVRLRANGLEPAHKNGTYLPRSIDDLT